MKFIAVSLGYVMALVLFLASLVSAQVDPAKALLGRWEGNVEGTKNPDRVLIVDSVSPKDGTWVAEGRFGQPPKGQPVTIDVALQDGKLVLEFIAGGQMKNPWKLMLVGDNQLEGTGNFVGGGRKTIDRRIKLEKVAR